MKRAIHLPNTHILYMIERSGLVFVNAPHPYRIWPLTIYYYTELTDTDSIDTLAGVEGITVQYVILDRIPA